MNVKKETIKRIRTKIIWIYHKSDGHRWILVLYILIGAIQSLLSVSYALIFKQMVDYIMGEYRGSIYQMVLLIAMILLSQELLSALQSALIVRTKQKITNQMKEEVFASVVHANWLELEKFHSGDIVNRLENDSSTIVACITDTIPQVINSFIRISFAFGTMLYLDWVVAVISVITLPIMLIITRSVLKRLRKFNKELRIVSSESTSYTQESVQQAMVIKSFQMEEEKINGLKKLYNQILDLVIKRNILGILSGSILSGGFSIGYLLAFLVGAWRMETGMISFGTMTAFLQLISQVQNPLYNLANVIPAFVSISIAAERLMELNELERERCEQKEIIKAPVGILFSHVTFSYETLVPVLKDVSCRFEAGKATAIIGKTGEGKTTLLKLLLAFLMPQQGKIYLENADGKVLNGIEFRNTYTYVPQGNTLFSGTIKQNLLMGNQDQDRNREELRKAIVCASAEFLYELPNGLDTKIGEKGAGLSEGQALRVAIVRGLLRNAPIMIFDESTAALDEMTQLRVFTQIREGYKNRTLLFVTHKLSLAWKCDRIFEIENQKVKLVKKEEYVSYFHL